MFEAALLAGLLRPGLEPADTEVQCPLWVISGHCGKFLRCPLFLRKRILIGDVRFVPIADIDGSTLIALFTVLFFVLSSVRIAFCETLALANKLST